MKKYLFAMVAMTALMSWCNIEASSAQTTKVWITTGKSATKYHKQKDCRAIKRLDPSTIKQLSITEAKNTWGRSECLFCYGKSAAGTTAKKEDAKKTAEKKTTAPKQTASVAKVWITTEGKATKYHKQKDCRALKQLAASSLKQVPVTEAQEKWGRSECAYCYKTTATKTAAAKTTAKKTTTAKATTATKKTTEAKSAAEKKTTAPAAKTTTKASTTKKAADTKKATETKPATEKKTTTPAAKKTTKKAA